MENIPSDSGETTTPVSPNNLRRTDIANYWRRNNFHRYEIPLLTLAIGLVTLITLTALYIIFFPKQKTYTLEEIMSDPQAAQNDSNLTNTLMAYSDYIMSALIIFPLLVFAARGLQYAIIRTNSVEITPFQYPNEYNLVSRIAQEYGLKEVPRVFVKLGNGVINAASSGYGFKRFIFINSDLFEVGVFGRNPRALAFVIAHESGHIAAGHTSYWRMLLNTYASYIPIVGKALSRAQEYTADNYAYSFIPTGAKDTMSVLANGKYLVNSVEFPPLVRSAVVEKGFFVWLGNLLGTHPVLTWRSHALQFRNEPGAIFFKPKYYPPSSAGETTFMPEFPQNQISNSAANPPSQ